MSRPRTGRRLHGPAFDEILRLKGTTAAELARHLTISEGHLSDLRSGRRLVTPPTARSLADALNLGDPDAVLWPAAAESSAA